uniref:Pyroglutamyl-peptidase I like n=1 Tax=Labrus bergylta TaxID=56723 RepID=A0A3Q3F4W4_9LABR
NEQERRQNTDERFGPFRQFLVNPSWKAAQELKLVGLGENTDIYIKELPVSYHLTLTSVFYLIQFAVHLGIARGSSGIILEQTGKNCGYRDKDVCGFCPKSLCCVEGGPEKLDSIVNMRAVSKTINAQICSVTTQADACQW